MRLSLAAAGVFLFWSAIASDGPAADHRSRRTGPRLGADSSPRRAQAHALGTLPLSFEKNTGQANASAKFVARQSTADIFLTERGLAVALKDPPADPERTSARTGTQQRPGIVRLDWSGGRAREILGVNELPGKANYLRGREPSRWRTGVPTYAMVKYVDLYAGIDLLYYGNQSRLEYDFIVAPGADASAIGIALEGADRVALGEHGELVLGVGNRTVTQPPPRLYQEVDGRRREVAGSYVLVADRQLAFRVGEYDRSETLVIDPVLEFSTYLGGSRYDDVRGIALDPEGNIYLVGQTSSSDFETTDSVVQRGYGGGGTDAFVVKLSADGLTALYSTFLGGSGDDVAYGVGVDRWGQACLTGYTRSTDFPIANALQGELRGGPGDFDAFVAKLDAQGTRFIYSTYLGGSDVDSGRAIAVDPDGTAYIAGTTSSRDFPVVNAYQPNFGGPMADAFVARLNPEGDEYFYVTYLGGRLYDAAFGIAADSDGNAYVVGTTGSPDFPTRAPIYPALGRTGDVGDFDAFIAKFYWDGSLVYSTFIGGSDVDTARAVAVDAWGNAYLTGDTASSDFPTINPLQSQYGGSGDAFAAKVNVEGSALVYSTYLGGSRLEQGYGIAVDRDGSAVVTGCTSSTNFPTANPIQEENHGADDVFISRLTADGSNLVFSTYLGGRGPDVGFAVAVDDAGNAYVAGSTSSVDFPTWSSKQSQLRGVGNGFAAKVGSGEPRIADKR